MSELLRTGSEICATIGPRCDFVRYLFVGPADVASHDKEQGRDHEFP